MTPDDRAPRAPILAGFSPSSAAREPVEFGIAASRVTGAPLIVMAIRREGPPVNRGAGTVDEDAVAHLREELERGHVPAQVVVRDARTAGGGLAAALEELSAQMIVLGATRRSAGGAALLGTTIERVIHTAACPVAVVPHGYRRPDSGVSVIGAAFVPTPEGRDALDFATALARAGSVKLRAIVVLDPERAEQRRRTQEELGLEQALSETASGVEAETDVLYSDPARGLLGASRQMDLLVMGSRARGPRRATVLGSVSRRVAEQAVCPVLIVPRGPGGSHIEALNSS
jgi:nucleotide-binding universal stress UspA family protein